MMKLVKDLALVAGLLALRCQGQATPASSVFVEQSANMTFAVNLPENSQDLFFHLSAPLRNAWFAVGAGRSMLGSLMFIAYRGENETKVTLSPRIASAYREPQFQDSIQLEMLEGSGYQDGILTARARCRNCRTWSSGQLDTTSTSQPFVYAFGSSGDLQSDSPSASLRQHQSYGRFTLNMAQATGEGGVPITLARPSGATSSGTVADVGRVSDVAIAHGVFMSLAFLLLLPMGVAFMRPLGKPRWHFFNQSFAVVIILIGWGLGLSAASKLPTGAWYGSYHQILGFIVVGLVLLQAVGGFTAHQIFKKTSQKNTVGKVHRGLGYGVILLGFITGFTGFAWADLEIYIIPYAIVGVVVAGVIGFLVFWRYWRGRRTRHIDGHGQESGPVLRDSPGNGVTQMDILK
ncbi:MAG: hypothetical protein M1823_003015 [Watsoniomyces obsoletus]|nr:MAG: hypothetical protein M1823_003015 [Watsoniomyces obsoletus]